MRVVVRGPSISEALELVLEPDQSVSNVKLLANASRRISTQTHLIYAGAVREDVMKIAELGINDGSVVWLLPSDIEDMEEDCGAECAASHDSGAPLELPSMCASGHAPPSSAQGRFGGGRLRRFLQEHTPSWTRPGSGESAELEYPAFWALSRSEWSAFERAVAALETDAPKLGEPAHISWFGEYGCVLLAEMIRPATIHLRLVCLDGWTFWEHSHPGGRSHTATPARNTPQQLPIGVIETEECGANELTGARPVRSWRGTRATGLF